MYSRRERAFGGPGDPYLLSYSSLPRTRGGGGGGLVRSYLCFIRENGYARGVRARVSLPEIPTVEVAGGEREISSCGIKVYAVWKCGRDMNFNIFELIAFDFVHP